MTTTLPNDLDVLERIGTALADPTRRRMLTMLLAGPAYPAELAEEAGQQQLLLPQPPCGPD